MRKNSVEILHCSHHVTSKNNERKYFFYFIYIILTNQGNIK